jgi:hypothetical protein
VSRSGDDHLEDDKERRKKFYKGRTSGKKAAETAHANVEGRKEATVTGCEKTLPGREVGG